MKTLFTWLLHCLFFSGTMFFAAAPVADLGGADGVDAGGDPGNAGELLPSDLPAEGEGVDPGAANAEKTAPPVGTVDSGKLDNRTLPAAVKTVLAQLQATDPKAHTWLKDELHANLAFRREFPGGLKEAQDFKTAVQSFKTEFPDGIEGVKAERAEWAGIDEAWGNADPKVLDVWRDSNPEAFAKLVPVAMGQLATSNPAAYSHFGANLISNTLSQSNVRSALHYLDRAIQMKDGDAAASLVKEINQWVAQIDETAKNAPKAPEKNPQDVQRETALNDREHKIWVNETATPINTMKSAAIRKELAQYTKGAELDADTLEAFERQVHVYLNKALTDDPTFAPTFQKYMDAQDRAGLTAFMESKVKQFLPSQPGINGKPGTMGPVERAYKLFNKGATVKPAPRVAVTPGTETASRPAAGWTKVAKAPEPHEIAPGPKNWESIFKHKAAVMKDGRKLYWGANAPPA